MSDTQWMFDDLPVGSIERFVEGCWSLSMLRFHIETNKITPTIRKRIDDHNNMRNISVLEFDLNTLVHTYRTDVSLNDALEEKDELVWLWFNNSQVLVDSNFAGWLRSRLTVRDINNLRCVFITEGDAVNSIFFDYSAPLYLATNNLLKYFEL
ncbi:hypothetical protein [Photobacterium kishitanii]|uniref:Uncharacterized protein n=1 Tax=Photobacterium kishitanii TaxID=318456 RepID=A0A2T3KLB6_9GAMM|nr:hypothetical protein [Photobacterium kishitanii]PSV00449.1 hypothetical protein C9J27_04775 [Photobacterium kishitanii]